MVPSAAIRGGRRRGAATALAGLWAAILALGAQGVAAAAADARAAPAGLRGAGEAPAEAPEPQTRRALIVFLPAGPHGRDPILDELADRGLAVGLMSPTVGGHSEEQMALDMSQGARVPALAYPRPLELLDLRIREGSGRIAGWASARARAQDAAGAVVPGLLASTVAGAGGRVSYAGVIAASEAESIVAADRRGRIERAALVTGDTLTGRTLELLRDSALVVTRLPEGRSGRAALDRLLAERGPGDLVCVVQAPPGRLELIATGIAAPTFGGLLRSNTTRRRGLVAAPDVAATVLGHLGIDQPAAVQGEEIESTPGTVGDLRQLARRLEAIVPRRDAALKWLALAWAALLGVLALTRRGPGARAALRISFLSALWLPAVALLTAALGPAWAVEIAVLAAGSLALGALTDRLVPWPAGPVAPATTVVVAHAIDLAAGSPLIAASLAGPNPRGGARFFGVGNELETILSVSVLVGTGSALALAGDPHGRRSPRAFAGACLAAAVVIGAGRLGAAVGGVITLAAAGAAAVLASLPARPGRRALAIAVAAPLAALAALAGLDLATAGGTHFSREVLEAGGPGDVLDIVRRRLDLSAAGLERGGTALAVAVAAALVVAGVAMRRRLLAPLDRAGPVAAHGLRAGLLGALVATIVGALVNDSGPMIFLIGSAMLLLAVAYVQGRPRGGEAASSTIPRCA